MARNKRYVAHLHYHNMQQEKRPKDIPWRSGGPYGCGWSTLWPGLCYLPDLVAARKLEDPNMLQNSAPVTWPGMEIKRKRLRASNPKSFNCISELLSYRGEECSPTPSLLTDLIFRKIQRRSQTALPPRSSCGSSPLLSLDESTEKAFPQLAYSSLHSPTQDRQRPNEVRQFTHSISSS